MPTLYTYYGTATHYNPTGTTACQINCDDSCYLVAYPNVYGYSPDYTASCGGTVQAHCGDNPLITNLCDGTSNYVGVYDHGPPCCGCYVDPIPCYFYGYSYAYRFLDLSDYAYTVMNGGPSGKVLAQLQIVE